MSLFSWNGLPCPGVHRGTYSNRPQPAPITMESILAAARELEAAPKPPSAILVRRDHVDTFMSAMRRLGVEVAPAPAGSLAVGAVCCVPVHVATWLDRPFVVLDHEGKPMP